MGGCTQVVHGRSVAVCMSIDPRIPYYAGTERTSGFHPTSRQTYCFAPINARSIVRCSASRMKGNTLHVLLRTARKTDFCTPCAYILAYGDESANELLCCLAYPIQGQQ